MPNQEHKIRKIKWKRIGSGSHRLPNGTIVGPGEVFEATPDEIPMAFRDVIRAVSPEELQVLSEPPPITTIPPAYKIKSRGPGKWDVVDGQGKAVNEKPLTRNDAEGLVKSLGG